MSYSPYQEEYAEDFTLKQIFEICAFLLSQMSVSQNMVEFLEFCL